MILTRIVFILSAAAIISGCGKTKQFTDRKNETSLRYRETVLNYMAQPDFTSLDFSQQVTGTPAQLKLYDLDEMMLYFAINKKDFDSSATLKQLTVNPEKVQFGFEGNGVMVLGEYTLRGTERMLFRIPRDDFYVDSTKQIYVDLGKFKYTISMNELADFAENISIYGKSTKTDYEKEAYVTDHGTFISVKNEPSLKRLVSQIIDSASSKEIQSQMLLDFVTEYIKFSNIEAYGGYEVLKRPNEILMTGKSDCSGLTILYASLLEQIEADYVLAYYHGHICPAVCGNFPKANGQNFSYNGKNYSIAETTVKGFQLGKTFLEKDFTVEAIRFIQRPGENSEIIKFRINQ